MALLKTTECKDILGLSSGSTAYDTQISRLIPYIQQDICDYCNHYFMDTVIYRQGSGGIAFVRGDTSTATTQADKITDDLSDFSTNGFRTGMDIAVVGGSNEGIYTLAIATESTLTLTSTGDIESVDQDAHGNRVGEILIARIKWPKALKVPAAKMVWHLIDKPTIGDIKSESIDDYSVTYAGEHSYPTAVIKDLDRYRRAVLI